MCGIHPVFHVSMLEPATHSAIPNRVEDPLPPIEIDSDIEYEVSEILDSKVDRRRKCKILYLVRWSGYEGTDKETSWITADELSHAKELVQDLHSAYPTSLNLRYIPFRYYCLCSSKISVIIFIPSVYSFIPSRYSTPTFMFTCHFHFSHFFCYPTLSF